MATTESCVRPNGMCSDHTILVDQGMTQICQVFEKYMKESKPIEYTSHVPRRVRIELTSKLREDILPALLGKITLFSQTVDLTMPAEIFEFKFEPVLGILKDMDQLCVDLVNLMTSARNGYKLEYASYPKFVRKKVKPPTEPMEEFSYLTWIELLSNVNQCLTTLISNLTSEKRWMYSDDYRRYDPVSTKAWFDMASRTNLTFQNALKSLERSDFQIYLDMIQQVTSEMWFVRVMDNWRGDDSEIEHCLEEAEVKLWTSNQKYAVSKCIKNIDRLLVLLLNKLSKYAKFDSYFLRKMDAIQLESLIRHTGIHIGEYDNRSTYLSFDQYILSLDKHLESFLIDAKYPPCHLDHKQIGRKVLLGQLEKSLIAIFKILDQHLDQLSIHHPSSDLKLHNSIQETRKWSIAWKKAWNSAVNHYLVTYTQVYASPYHQTHCFNKAKYWGKELQ